MIAAGGESTLLSHIFLVTGRTPDEILAKSPGIRAFCYASIRRYLSEQPPGPGQG